MTHCNEDADLRVPVVDLNESDDDAARAVRAASESVGFFHIRNHGVAPHVVDEVFSKSKAFFALPLEEKSKLTRAPGLGVGYVAMEKEILDRGVQRRPCTNESIRIGTTLSGGRVEDSAFPDASVLPGFRETMIKYHESMTLLARRVLGLLLMSVGLPPDHLDDKFITPLTSTRLVHYSPEVSCPEDGVYATGPHTDWGVLTILATDDVPGLEVEVRRNTWVCAPPIRGALVVNVGDTLSRWTNDTLRSTRHRVVNRVGKERYSVPFFFNASPNATIACLQPFLIGEKPKYEPIIVGDYIDQKFREITCSRSDLDVKDDEVIVA